MSGATSPTKQGGCGMVIPQERALQLHETLKADFKGVMHVIRIQGILMMIFYMILISAILMWMNDFKRPILNDFEWSNDVNSEGFWSSP